MRIFIPLIALTALGTNVIAQTDQRVEMQGIRTSYTDRAGVSRGTGEVLQGFHSSHHRGLAENGGKSPQECLLTQLFVVHQDQNASTIENYDLVVRKGDDTNGPIGGTAGLYGSVTGLKTPGGTGIRAWGTTVTLTASGRIKVAHDKFFAVGLNFANPAPNMWADAHGVHTSWGSSGKQDMGSWTEDHTSTSQDPSPDHAWQLIGTTTVASHPGSYRTWRIGFSTHGAALQLGTGGGYGMGGMFPKWSTASTPLPFTGRVRLGSAYTGATVVIAAAPAGFFPVSFPLGPGAHVYINMQAMVVFIGPAADGNGQSVVQLAPFVPDFQQQLPRFTIPFQAAGASASAAFKLTNVQVVEPH